MRTLSVQFRDEKNKDINRPVELYQVFLDDITLYLACYNKDIQFFNEMGQPETYYAIGIGRSPIRMNMDNKIDECTVGIDNVNREMSAFIAITEFRGRRMRILKVMLDALNSSANAAILFDGKMDAPSIDEHSLRVKVRSQLDTLTITAPRRYYQASCNWRFGSPECGVSLTSLIKTGTVTSQASNGRDFVLSGRSEAKDHYVGGVLTVDGKSQKIIESNGSSIRLEYSLPLGMVGKPYQIRQGCGKDKADCQKFSNFARYGGFLSVPQNQVKI